MAHLQIKRESIHTLHIIIIIADEVELKLSGLGRALIYSIRLQCCARSSVKRFGLHQTSALHTKNLDESEDAAQGWSKTYAVLCIVYFVIFRGE